MNTLLIRVDSIMNCVVLQVFEIIGKINLLPQSSILENSDFEG